MSRSHKALGVASLRAIVLDCVLLGGNVEIGCDNIHDKNGKNNGEDCVPLVFPGDLVLDPHTSIDRSCVVESTVTLLP